MDSGSAALLRGRPRRADFPQRRGIPVGSRGAARFNGAAGVGHRVALFVGAMPRKEGMERKDLLNANVKIFKSQGTALDKFAKKTVKVNLFFI